MSEEYDPNECLKGWHLTGETARRFLDQIENAGPNYLAREAIERGRPIFNEVMEKGYAIVYPKKKST